MPQTLDSVAVARETVDAFNDAAWDRFEAILGPDSTYDEFATGRHIEGAGPIIDANREWKRAFPDATGTIERVIESGDTVTLELTWHGHHTGPLPMPDGELAPTGREITVKAVEIIDAHDGKVISDHHYFDMAGMLAQLGVN